MAGLGAPTQIASLFAVIGADLSPLNRGLRSASFALTRFQRTFGTISDAISNVGRALTLGITFPVIGLGTAIIGAATKWESAFIGVRKTVDATEEQFAELDKQLRDMSHRIPLTPFELAGIAEIAGQLGFPIEQIEQFTETVAQMAASTNMSAEEAAMSLARFLNITKELGPAGTDMARQSELVGAAIVDLGNNFATTETEISSMALRIASAGAVANMTQDEILGIAAALSSLGVHAEMGGTAISRVILNLASAMNTAGGEIVDNTDKMEKSREKIERLKNDIAIVNQQLSEYNEKTKPSTIMRAQERLRRYNEELEEEIENLAALREQHGMLKDDVKAIYAEVMGISVEELTKMWEEGPTDAILAFIQGLGRMADEGKDILPILKDLKLSNVRTRDVLLRAAAGYDTLTAAVDRAHNAYRRAIEGDSALVAEAEKRFKSFESQLKITKNLLIDMGITIGTTLLPPLNEFLKTIKPIIERMIDWAETHPEQTKLAVAIAATAAAVGPLLMLLSALMTPMGQITFTLSTLIALFSLGDDTLSKLGDTVKTFASDALRKLGEKIKNTDFGQLAKDILNGIAAKSEDLNSWAISFIGSARDALAEGLGVESTWSAIGQKMIEKIKPAVDALATWASELGGKLIEALANALGAEDTSYESIVTAILGGLGRVVIDASEFAGNILHNIAEFVGSEKAQSYMEEIGENLATALATFFQSDTKMGEDVITALIGAMAQAAIDVSALMANLLGTMEAFIKSDAATTFVQGIGKGLGEAIAKVFDIEHGLGVGILLAIIRNIARAIASSRKIFGTIAANFLGGFIEGLTGTKLTDKQIEALAKVIAPVSVLGKKIDENLEKATATLIGPAWEKIGEDPKTQQQIYDMLFPSIGVVPQETINEAQESGTTISGEIISGIVTGMNEKKAEANDAIKDIANTLINIAQDILGIRSPSKVFLDIGKAIGEGLKAGIVSKIREIANAAADMVRAAIQAAREAAAIASPSKEFAEIGELMGQGLAEGTLATTGLLNDSWKQIIDGIVEDTEDGFKRIKEGWLDNAKKFRKVISRVIDNVNKAFERIDIVTSILSGAEDYIKEMLIDPLEESLSGVEDEIKTLQRKFYLTEEEQARLNELLAERDRLTGEIEAKENRIAQIREKQTQIDFLRMQLELLTLIKDSGLDAKDILSGIQLGLEADAEAIFDAMSQVLDALIEQVNEQLGIASPSKVFEKIGQLMMAGMEKGIKESMLKPAVATRDAITQIANNNMTMNRKDVIVINDRSAQAAFWYSRRETELRKLAMGMM